jgi:low affinity Fe/Cu permease
MKPLVSLKHPIKMRKLSVEELFPRFAKKTAHVAGTPTAFLIAFLIVLTWAITGPLFRFSDTWQLVINTGTTVITFLMVFLIQYAQNRDTLALHLKLDELIKAAKGARNQMIDLENLTDDELAKLESQYKMLVDRRHTASHTPRTRH